MGQLWASAELAGPQSYPILTKQQKRQHAHNWSKVDSRHDPIAISADCVSPRSVVVPCLGLSASGESFAATRRFDSSTV